ncbi:MAG: UDP-N-acetylmuramoyl-L-alanyl-D-glutamate--2,6-diaminopimelate ligase [Oscillospiraceae bacterium]|jgi:UDP-N-acetylmuramoyl-L-alanyl-D-glutamate--2,6-diaminopimelate ligase|nr:UDP-N-acetylmuramoyl-L-alanyl-D-glutamate--2,6-diaminopimelate ligase [Oscillospiraceae bacterium]
MKLGKLLEKVNIAGLHADKNAEISAVCYDSRAVTQGSLFVALSNFGANGEDRHAYIGAAAENGAACVICERKPETDVPYVLVGDSQTAFAVVSANFYENAHEKLKIVGVTGTNGKTTVTHLIKQMLEKLTEKPVGLIGTTANMVGEAEYPTGNTTPEASELHGLFARMVDAGCEYAVMEVSSHALTLGRVHGITFEVGVFTNLTRDHLDFHKTFEEYAAAKAKIAAQSRLLAVNADDDYTEVITRDATVPVFAYSTAKDAADLVAKQIKLHASRVEFCALMTGVLARTELAIPGMFSVYNGLAAMLAVRLLGFSLGGAADALATCHGVKGRAEVVPTGRDFTVIIDYAHTPDALENIITTIRGCAEGRVVTLFGCGGDRDTTKRPIMGEVAARLSDLVIVTSDNPRTEVPSAIIADILTGMTGTKTPVEVIENRREAIAFAIENAQPNDTIILAGKGHETYQIIGTEKTHFDEREVVAEALR